MCLRCCWLDPGYIYLDLFNLRTCAQSLWIFEYPEAAILVVFPLSALIDSHIQELNDHGHICLFAHWPGHSARHFAQFVPRMYSSSIFFLRRLDGYARLTCEKKKPCELLSNEASGYVNFFSAEKEPALKPDTMEIRKGACKKSQSKFFLQLSFICNSNTYTTYSTTITLTFTLTIYLLITLLIITLLVHALLCNTILKRKTY